MYVIKPSRSKSDNKRTIRLLPRKIDLVLFILILWGPILIFGINPYRNPESSLRYELDKNSAVEIVIWASIGLRVLFYIFNHIILHKRLLPSKILHGAPFFYLLYGLIGLISIFYSSAFLLTGFRAYQVIIGLIFIGILARDEDMMSRLFSIFTVFCVIVTLYNFVMFFLDPLVVGKYTGEGYRLLGGFPFNRDFGIAAAVAISLCLTQLSGEDKKIVYVGLLAVSVFVLLMSRVRSSIIGMIISIILTNMLMKNVDIKKIILSLILLILMFWTGVDQYLVSFIVRNPETLTHMSRRTDTWEKLWPYIMEKPLLGYGFGTGSRILLNDWLQKGIGIGDAHNSWMEALVSVGIIGTFFLFLSFLYAFINIQKGMQTNRTACTQLNYLIFFAFLGSMVSTSINLVSPMYILLILYSQFQKSCYLSSCHSARHSGVGMRG